MNSNRTFLLIISVIGIILSCNKDNTSSDALFTASFTNQADLNRWLADSVGTVSIDSSSVSFTNLSSCFHYQSINSFAIEKGKIYELKVKAKINQSQSGDPMLCAGDFIVYVVQGEGNLISESWGTYDEWSQQSFAFSSVSPMPVTIKFLIGTNRGAWINQVELVPVN